MKARSVRTLALMARVARVREIQAKQVLAEAIGQKDMQLVRTGEAQGCADRSDGALFDALHGPMVDLSRLPLLHELSSYVQAMLADEREQLRQREQDVTDQIGVAAKQARYRERLEETATAAVDDLRQAGEARQLEMATDAWLIRRNAEAA